MLRSHYRLEEIEKWWVEHQPFLLSRGYALRPRYKPNWTPSWELPGNEDLSSRNVLDAVRIADNVKVVLKLVSTNEMRLSWWFGQCLPALEPDSRNRGVPLLERLDFKALNIIDEKYDAIVVFPFLRQFDDPPFRQLSEVTEAVGQFLQGAEYMHARNVAHRDLCQGNLMMDALRIIPRGWHFSAPWSHCGTKVGIKSKPRSAVGPIDYYVIDYGLAEKFFDVLPEDVLDVGRYGQDKTVPELSETVPYNPFKVDIYQLGYVIMKLVETYEGLEIFRNLAENMTRKNPDERPTASECVKLFYDLMSTISEDTPVHMLASSDSDDSSVECSESDSESDPQGPQPTSKKESGSISKANALST
ncbi:hypothetical protein B0H12DRAFT_1165383 [Mycena haematopus]|nr:hypothetical protein B0H12DRAFT_1165383 [Mycena haematopus]